MSDGPESQPESGSQPEWSGETAPRVYANVLGINAGPFDLMLIFGMQQAPPPTGAAEREPPPIEEVVRVSMSWGHAKSMIPLLAKMVADYETKYGEVPAPGFEDTWRQP